MYSTVPEGTLPLRLKPTFAKAKATSAQAKTSMISSVRRLLRATGTSGPVGSTAGDGAVMLLTSVLRPGKGHRPRCGTPLKAGTSPRPRTAADPG